MKVSIYEELLEKFPLWKQASTASRLEILVTAMREAKGPTGVWMREVLRGTLEKLRLEQNCYCWEERGGRLQYLCDETDGCPCHRTPYVEQALELLNDPIPVN